MHAFYSFIRVFLLLITVLIAVWITRFIPPLQSPDENAHLLRADMISHGQWFLKQGPENKGIEGGEVDSGFYAFIMSMLTISGPDKSKEQANQLIVKASNSYWSGVQIFDSAPGTGYNFPIIYLPHASGLYIARQLNISMMRSYELTRALVAATTLSLLVWAFTLFTPNTLTIALLLTPMALFQWLSPTIDALCAALALVAIGLWFTINQQKDTNPEKISWHEIVLHLIISLLCTAKVNLAPLMLIPIILLLKNYSRKRLAIVAIMCTAIFCWIFYVMLSIYDNRVIRHYSNADVALIYFTDPAQFFELLWNTVTHRPTRKFYRYSFVGVLGWMDVHISKNAERNIYTLIVLALLLAVFSGAKKTINLKNLSLMIIGMGSAFLIFYALAVTWTNYPAPLISGVQGRYFIIPALVMSASLEAPKHPSKTYQYLKISVIGALAAYTLHTLIQSLSDGYSLNPTMP